MIDVASMLRMFADLFQNNENVSLNMERIRAKQDARVELDFR